MNRQVISRAAVFAVLVMVVSQSAWSQDGSGFLDDYSKLQVVGAETNDRVYVASDAIERLQGYNAIMVDQPEIFLAPDSKYKGAKPDALKTLSDTARMAMIERLEAGGYTTTDQPGPDVLFIRWAITDLYLKKKKRGILSFTPVGFVVHTTAQAAIRDLWKKIDIVELNIEAEFLDSSSGGQLAALVISRGAKKTKTQEQDPVSWEELDAAMRTFGTRVRCNLDNSRLPPAQHQDCSQIVIEPEGNS